MGRRPDLDDLDREMREHIEAETEELVARGLSPADARAAALRKFGNPLRVKEDVRAVWVPGWLDQLRQDARDALRHLRRNPAFSLAVIVTLALGIGLTTAIYSVVNAVLIRPLSYQHPDRMVWLTTQGKTGPEIMSSIDFAAWHSQATSLEHMIGYDYTDATVVVGGEASRIRIVSASDGFWQVSGAQPLLGALPTPQEPQVLALAHRVFREQFRSDPQVIGRAVMVDGQQMTIGAVLPEDFEPQLVGSQWWLQMGERVNADAYRVMRVDPPPRVIDPRSQVRTYQVFGALRPGVSIEQARAEIEAIHARERRERPSPFGSASTAVVVPLQEKIVGPSRLALSVLLSASIVLLLITCANVANLLLSRSAARRKEIALRMSVGSGPLRVVRQLLVESLGYALLGGIGGLLLASWLVDAVISLLGPAMPRLTETTLDVGVLAVALGLSIATALLFGVGPAIALCFTNVQEVLKEGGRSVSASRRVLFAGRAMAALQVALTVVLLAGAGLMLKSVWQMTTPAPGFVPDQLLTMRVDFRGPQYREQQARHDYTMALLARARTLPGVQDVGLTSGRGTMMLVLKEGEEPRDVDREARGVPVSSISASFPRLLGMSLVSGRWFEEGEVPGNVLINESLARSVFDGEALGARIRLPWTGGEGLGTIVGVLSDLKYTDIDTDTKPEIFFHHAEQRMFGATVVMRIDGDPIAAAPSIRKALSAIDPTQSFYEIQTMEQALVESIAPRRFNVLLLGTFAIVALVLAVLGVYGVVAYAVSARTHEIGIRLALGAHRARVVRMIVAQGMGSVIVGIFAGLLAALMATRLIAGLLYGVEATDATTFALSTVVLTAVAFMACCVPALRAALVDPVRALRAE